MCDLCQKCGETCGVNLDGPLGIDITVYIVYFVYCMYFGCKLFTFIYVCILYYYYNCVCSLFYFNCCVFPGGGVPVEPSGFSSLDFSAAVPLSLL